MPLDMDGAVAEVRGRLGDLSDGKLPEGQVQLAVAAALREFARFKPRRQSVIITLAADTFLYDLPAGAIDVWDWDVKAAGASLDPLQLGLGGLSGAGETELVRQDEWLDSLIDEVQVVEGATPQLEVVLNTTLGIPQLSASFKIVATIDIERGIGEVSSRDLENVIKFAMGECLGYLGTKRSKPVVRIPTANGTLVLDTGKLFIKHGETLKQEARDRMGIHAAVVGLG